MYSLEMEAKLKMLGVSLRVTRMNKIRSEYIRGTAQLKWELKRNEWDDLDVYRGGMVQRWWKKDVEYQGARQEKNEKTWAEVHAEG